ncbi:hypothetical protein FE257_000748 [Aspergillus nanangensis]|uniref:Uncharacterized protein n=1 Tax=Aspergillus nanangensis TaxID=2582783 RepID=A0AAD4CFZ2_ASPNN|nr:hypothetical protein FE257_000748 [Aspergillus nanangensis]
MSGFLALPLEIREEVYRYVLVKPRIFTDTLPPPCLETNLRRSDAYLSPREDLTDTDIKKRSTTVDALRH